MSSRLTALAALLALFAIAGCGRDEGVEAARPALPPETVAHNKAMEGLTAERKRLMTEVEAAQKAGDRERAEAAAKAIAENRRKAADLVRDHKDNLSSNKEQTK